MVRKALPEGLGQQLVQQWRHSEAAYLQALSLVFAQLRAERAVYPGHYAAVRNVYLVYLQRTAQDKQDKVCSHSSFVHSLYPDFLQFDLLESPGRQNKHQATRMSQRLMV